MTRRPARGRATSWAEHDGRWRAPAQIVGLWESAATVDPRVLRHTVVGPWWDLIAEMGITLLVTREYEHLALAMCARAGRPLVSYLALPHPSGIAVDGHRVFVASTRNPNQVITMRPFEGPDDVGGRGGDSLTRTLAPVRADFLPGGLYLHDLALVGGALHGNAVGQNAVVRIGGDGSCRRVWWPRSIETPRGPLFGPNHLQLNSIAAGRTLAGSFFSASAERPLRLRPGHRTFPVDGRGVIFSGRTREPVCRGLTRPHSARLHAGTLWVANSGYGEIGVASGGRFTAVQRLPGWTRGVCVVDRPRAVAFVGTSRVIPRFRQYAPGLDVDRSACGVHAIDLATGRTLAALTWPEGNQTFAIDWMPSVRSAGFPFRAGRRPAERRMRSFFSALRPVSEEE